jgi:tRNA nucleotidyltransferase (CCA-adding enzyme)
MVGKRPYPFPERTSMHRPKPQIEPAELPGRIDALPGIDRLREAARGLSAYLVGGAVRDLLLGRGRADIDVAVEGDPLELARRLGGATRAHERFGTATVDADGLRVDIAATRSETYAHPGALPEVRAAPLGDDLARRDFTINAMAVPLAAEHELIDPHGGLGDLQGGRLRVLHPESLVDDPTRAVRAARYASRYGFALDPETEQLVRRSRLETVSGDRLDAALGRLAAEEQAARGFELLDGWGLIELLPGAVELTATAGELADAQPWVELVTRPEAVLAAALGRGVDPARELAAAIPERPSEAVELASGHSATELLLARALGGEWLDRYASEWRHVHLEIGGDDMMAAGVEEGPAIGRGLEAALRAKLDGEASGSDEELRVALAAARADG